MKAENIYMKKFLRCFKLSASAIALSGTMTNQVIASDQERLSEEETTQPLTSRINARNLSLP